MKKLFAFAGLLLFAATAFAQSESNIFSHFGGSVGIGTTGLTIDLTTNVTDFVGIRAGVDIMPKVKYSTTVEIDGVEDRQVQYDMVRTLNPHLNLPATHFPDKVDVEGKLNNTTGHVLVDLYPGKKTTLHFTVGAYFGPSEVVQVYTTKDEQLLGVAQYNDSQARAIAGFPKIGAQLGDFFLEPDATGHIDACVKTSGFRPYVGVGIGRNIPRKNPIGVSLDLGAQFWGTPKVYCQGNELTANDVEGEDGGVVKLLTKVKAYPTLTLRLTGKFF
jgi:hypothetical protein